MGMEVYGVRPAARRFRLIGDRARNVEPAWPSVGEEVASAMARQFLSSGSSGGAAWAPLNPEYLAWKVSRGLSPAILIATGEMMASLVSRPMDIETYRPTSAEFGTSNEKYKYHHFGTRNMAQRRALFWHPPMQQQTARILARYITKGRT